MLKKKKNKHYVISELVIETYIEETTFIKAVKCFVINSIQLKYLNKVICFR